MAIATPASPPVKTSFGRINHATPIASMIFPAKSQHYSINNSDFFKENIRSLLSIQKDYNIRKGFQVSNNNLKS